MTPRGHSSISDAVETELQILATERENVTSLLCTKARRTRGIRKDWRRDFYYDQDSFTVTPVAESTQVKDALVSQLKRVKEALGMSDRELSELIGVNFSTIARWFRCEMLPVENRINKINIVLIELEKRLGKDATKLEAKPDATENATERNTTSDASLPIKIYSIEGENDATSSDGHVYTNVLTL